MDLNVRVADDAPTDISWGASSASPTAPIRVWDFTRQRVSVHEPAAEILDDSG